MTYHLLDHCNRRNAAELARTDLDARALGTLEWVPSSGMVEVIEPVPCSVGKFMRSLGFGNKISCSNHILENAVANDPAASAYNSRYGMNVCRPFDEAHAANVAAGHDVEGANPHDTKRTLSEPYEPGDEVHYQLKPENMGFVRHTPPNHGHGARCLCFFYAPNWDLSLVDPEIQGRRRMTAMVLSSGQRVIVHSASTGLVSPQDCEWCAGTGRIICDDERAGRVSPSHAAGGYAEWQRCTMEFSVTDHDGTRPLGRITNMRSVDGFVVGDIELEDGSVVVERLTRSPFSSSEIGDAEPATTERE